MNILYINHYAGSPEYGMAFRPYYLAKAWTGMGHKVTIVGASFSHLRIKQPEVGEECIDGIRYVWLETPAYNGNGWSRVKNMLYFLHGLYFNSSHIVGNNSPDVVINSSTYPLDSCPGDRIAKKYKAKFVFEAHDLWPLSPMELGNMSKYHPFIMAMQFGENYAYKHADKVISILPCTKAHMCNHGLLPEKFVHIPNGINIDEWKRCDNKLSAEYDAILELKKNNVFLIGYAGGHAVSNALLYLLMAAECLLGEKLAVVLVGSGTEKEKLIRYAECHKLKNVYFLAPLEKCKIPTLLSYMDGLYIGWHKHSLYRFGISPNKIYDYMMAGKPIIHSVEAANDLVAEANCGISVAAEDHEAIAGAIRELMNMTDTERQRLGENGRKFVIKHHDYKVLAKKFIDAIED